MNDVVSPPRQVSDAAPTRDARFRVASHWRDCANFPDGDPRKTPEFLHRQMNEEVEALECSARTLCDFPDASWEIRMFLARQCSDEARHAIMFRRLFLKRGGSIGEYPVLDFQYRIICGFDTLIARLAVQNRTFEAEGIDAIEHGVARADSEGDNELALLFDAQFADEIMHVRVANEFIQSSIEREPRLVLKIASALHQAKAIIRERFWRRGIGCRKILHQ